MAAAAGDDHGPRYRLTRPLVHKNEELARQIAQSEKLSGGLTLRAAH